jgi:ATP-dependent Lon protease
MQAEIEILQVEKKIRSRVKKQMEKTQKEYYLNEQMQAIQKELGGERDEFKSELQEIEERSEEKKLSKEAVAKVKKELKKLKMMHPTSAEATVVRNYIDWILELPWATRPRSNTTSIEAEKMLDEDHYGLKKIKERIIEYLAVQALTKKLKGPVLCFVGPPGVGKTSLAKSIARGTGRKFVRLSLGGVRDEAEIRGHRRTYIGALPGKIMQSLKKAGTNNPVFLLDEVDKMSSDFRGDPAAALLEVLDPEQNTTFNDHYLDLDYDLSRRDVHHHRQHAARHPGAAAGPHGDHPALGLHRVREAQHRAEVPRAAPEARSAASTRCRSPHRGRLRTVIHHYTKESGVRSSSARSRASAARWRGRWSPRARTSRSRSTAKACRSTWACPSTDGQAEEQRRDRPRERPRRHADVGGDLLPTEASGRARQGQAAASPACSRRAWRRAAQAAMSYVRSRPRLGSSTRTSTRRSTCTFTSPSSCRRTGRARA